MNRLYRIRKTTVRPTTIGTRTSKRFTATTTTVTHRVYSSDSDPDSDSEAARTEREKKDLESKFIGFTIGFGTAWLLDKRSEPKRKKIERLESQVMTLEFQNMTLKRKLEESKRTAP